jgi:DNA-binding transcriptional LysR family regulator
MVQALGLLGPVKYSRGETKLSYMELDVRRLKVLREVALRGTITAAADSLGFTPSAISQQLSALEKEAGTGLLERSGRGVTLTDAGKLLVHRTEAVLVALEEAKAALEEWQGTMAGELRVAAAGSVARALVFPAVAELARIAPRLRITVLQHEPDESLRELRLGGLDVVVAHEYDHDRRPPEPNIVRVELFAEDMLVAAPTGRFAGSVALRDLAHEVWALDPPDSACGRAVRLACRTNGFEPDVRYNSTESSSLLSAIAEAGAVSLLPVLAFAGAPDGVEALPVADTATMRRLVFAARRQGTPARPSVSVMIERLQALACEKLAANALPCRLTPAP